MVNGFRYGFLGVSDISTTIGLAMLVLFSVILFGVNLRLLKQGTGIRS